MSFSKKILIFLICLVVLSSLLAYYFAYLGINKQIENDISKNENVVVLFSASWCGSCKKLKPHLKDALDESTGFKFYSIDSSLNKLEKKVLFKKYNIRGIPTLVLYKDGKELNRLMGVHTKDELLEAFSSLD